jgi:hypothetical protein
MAMKRSTARRERVVKKQLERVRQKETSERVKRRETSV